VETKNFLTSKTFQGILLMLLGVLLPRLGVDFGNAEMAAMADDIVVALGALWAAYGRIAAKKSIALGKGNGVTAALLLCLIALPLPACGVKQVAQQPAHEQARFYAQQLGLAYLDLSEGYIAAYPSMTPEQQQWCGKNLKPALEKLKIVSDAALSAAKAWSLAIDKCGDGVTDQTEEGQAALAECDSARQRYEELAVEAANLLAKAKELYQAIITKE